MRRVYARPDVEIDIEIGKQQESCAYPIPANARGLTERVFHRGY